METNPKNILVINGGSSSIKFAVYDIQLSDPSLEIKGQIDRIGDFNSHVKIKWADGKQILDEEIDRSDFAGSTLKLLSYLQKYIGTEDILAISYCPHPVKGWQ